MKTAPEIESYKKEEIEGAAKFSPAISRYLDILKRNPACFEDSLRLQRHDMWLRSALAIHCNRLTPREVCLYWSHAADQLIIKTWNHFELDKCDLSLFALGKLGSNELNMSSDVDLLIVGSPTQDNEVLKKIKRFKRALNDITAFGFALRVDFDLRPDGAWGPLIISIPHFQDHYWSRGETWERLAMIRLRAIAGEPKLVRNVFDLAERFCYRKYLDFTLMEDLKSLRARIHAKVMSQTHEIDLKLGVGGIRDAELFIHSLQVIHGGRNLNLRNANTTVACEKLAKELPEQREHLERLIELYWKMRDLENRVQIFCDEQTHLLRKNAPYPTPINEYWNQAIECSQKIDAIVSTLLGNLDHSKNRLPKSDDAQTEWLTQLGYSMEAIQSTWPEIIKSSALSHKKDRDENARKDFLHMFITALAEHADDKDIALKVFLDFVKSIRAKSTLFNLFLRNEKLMLKLVTLFSHSPYMGQVIASRPELIDSFLYGQHELSNDTEESLQILFEKRQLSEIHSAIDFFEQKNSEQIYLSLTSTADEIALSLQQLVRNEIPHSDFKIICMGKWGSKEIGFKSDLDFVLVKNGTINAEDHRASKRFINYMTSPQRGGKIYDIDMRLRPSGSSGPLLVSQESFFDYMKSKAQPWERQSYLKMRALNELDGWDPSFVVQQPLSVQDLVELKRIRQKLIRTRSENTIDIKYAAGGLIDIEFAAQTAILQKQITVSFGSTPHLLSILADADSQWRTKERVLKDYYFYLRQWEQLSRLTTQSSTTLIHRDSDTLRRSATLLKTTPSVAFSELEDCLLNTTEILKNLDPIHCQE